jgi:hypothetical protein
VCYESACAAASSTTVGPDGTAIAVNSEWDFERTERGPHNAGPARAVFAAPVVIIAGSGGGKAAADARARAAAILSLHVATAAHTRAPVLSDTDAVAAGLLESGVNVLLVGGADANAVTAALVSRADLRTGVRYDGARAARIGRAAFNASDGSALLYTAGFFAAGRPRLALVLDGNLDPLLSLAAPVPPPMVRAPFTNLVGDFILFGPRAQERGLGGVRAAGVWGADWAVAEAASFFAD